MPSVATITRETREQMILNQLPQVELLAKQAHRRCLQKVDLEELISAGTVGLIKAVDRYDPSRSCKLNTLAEHRIRGAILDYLRQLDPLPRAVRRFQKARENTTVRLEAQLGRTPVRSEIAGAMQIRTSEFERLSAIIDSAQPVSLEALPGVDTRIAQENRFPELAPLLGRLRDVTAGLPEPERSVIAGLAEGKTAAELAHDLGLHPTRVSQLKARAIARMRLAFGIGAQAA